jgi:formylglycine-generating enzyme required for sulfatase activity
MAFCKKLTEREKAAGRLPTGYTYTLPTEAQWEYACRAGTTGDFAGYQDVMAWYSSNSGGTTHSVGTKQPNAWGLYDMHGNVEEWCLDWYAKYSSDAVTDPVGPASGSSRVIRGGSWGLDAASCRSAIRYDYEPGNRVSDVGFRLALSAVR